MTLSSVRIQLSHHFIFWFHSNRTFRLFLCVPLSRVSNQTHLYFVVATSHFLPSSWCCAHMDMYYTRTWSIFVPPLRLTHSHKLGKTKAFSTVICNTVYQTLVLLIKLKLVFTHIHISSFYRKRLMINVHHYCRLVMKHNINTMKYWLHGINVNLFDIYQAVS